MSHPYFDVRSPTILGHRGAAGSAPENTLESFEKALELGADIIETDVHATSDGVPVLIHDSTVDRTTSGSGSVSDYSWEELRTLDAAVSFRADRVAGRDEYGPGVHIPSLRQAFERFPEAHFNLEIKSPGEALAAEILDLIAGFDRADRTLLTAGADPDMTTLRAALGKCTVRPAIGASLADILDVVRSAQAGEAPTTDSMALQIPAAFGDAPLVTPELLSHCRKHGILVHVWTINDPEEMVRLLELGVDGLVSDHPERLADVLGRGARSAQ